MAEKEPAEPDTNPGSAPELPGSVARKYGVSTHKAAPKKVPLGSTPPPGMVDPVPTIIEDDKTEAAVDDIVATESDALLQAEDERFAPTEQPRKRSFWQSVARPFVWWWHHKWLRWLTIMALLLGVTLVAIFPESRYAVLNTAGVRSRASVVVLDNTTQLPLKNVKVTIGGQQVPTDVKGVARFDQLKLGKTTLSIRRVAFESVEKDVTIGWGSNPFGSFGLTATGAQYVIEVHDYLSGQGLEGAEVITNDVNALSDKNGRATITIDDTSIPTELNVQVLKEGYRTEVLAVPADRTEATKTILVASRKTVFVNKQSGKYDVYAMDIDGANRKLVLAGTGTESSNISLVTNASGDRAVLVASRDNVRDNDGFLLNTLSLIDLSTGKATTLGHAAQIQLIDWIGNRLVYRVTMPGPSAPNSQRYRLISYDVSNGDRTQLAGANQFNAIVSFGGVLYYAPSATDPTAQLGLFKIKPDGTGKVQLFQQEVWTALRNNYTGLQLQTPSNWYAYAFGALQPTKIDAPSNFENFWYAEQPSGKQSAFVAKRDGKASLMLHDNTTGSDKVLHTHDGIAYPIRWLNDETIVYRVATAAETTDYVKSTKGGDSRKLIDVTNTTGFAQAY